MIKNAALARAAKEHICSSCGKEIKKGQLHIRKTQWTIEGKPYTRRICKACAKAKFLWKHLYNEWLSKHPETSQLDLDGRRIRAGG